MLLGEMFRGVAVEKEGDKFRLVFENGDEGWLTLRNRPFRVGDRVRSTVTGAICEVKGVDGSDLWLRFASGKFDSYRDDGTWKRV